jgi:hypothetical protein
MRIAILLAALAAALVARAAAASEASAGDLRFSPVPGLERAEGAAALALDEARGRLAVGDLRGVWLREADGRVRRALGSGPVHDLVFDADGALLAATARGLYQIGLDARVERRALGPGAAGRARRVIASPVAVFVATDAGVLAAPPGASFRPLDGALPSGETSAIAWRPGGGAAGTLYAIVAGDLYAAALASGPAGLTATSFRREPLAEQGGPPLDLGARSPDGAPLLLRQGAIVTREAGGWAAEPLVLPPGVEPLRASAGARGVWIASDAGLLGAETPAGPWRRAEGAPGGAASSAVLVASERVYAATSRGVFVGERSRAPAEPASAARSEAQPSGVRGPGARSEAQPSGVRGPGARSEAQPSEAIGAEPPVEAVHRVALGYLDLGRARITRLQRNVARRGLLPELQIHGDYGGFRTSDEDYDDTVFASGSRFELLDRLNERGRDFLVGVDLSWDLGDSVYNPDEIDVSKEVRELIELRDEVLDEINQLYFERRRVLLERARLADLSSLEAERLALRARELAAGLDAWTGGWWSRQLPPEPPSPRSNESQEERP